MVLWSLLVFSFFFRSHTITKKPSSSTLQAWALHTSSFPPLERQSPAQLETKSIKAPLLITEWGGFLLPGGTHRPLAHPNRFWTGMPSQTWCMSQSLVSMLPFSEVWWVAFIVNGNDEYLVSQSHILCSHSQHHLRPLLPSLHLQRRISPLCQRHLQHISVLGSNVLRGQLIFDTRTPIPWSINCCSRLQTTVAWWKHFG